MDARKISIDGVDYVRADSVAPAATKDSLEYCIIRTYSAGVFAGYVEKREGQEVTLREARRIYYWEGAASLSQLAQSGTSKPKKCKFPEAVDRVVLTQAIEVLLVTEKARAIIAEVPIWKE